MFAGGVSRPSEAPIPGPSGAPIHAPAKINLFLAVTGRRPDGYHEILSVAAPLAFGDELRVAPPGSPPLACDDPALPLDRGNLVVRAVDAFAAAHPAGFRLPFSLIKRIPGGRVSAGAAAMRSRPCAPSTPWPPRRPPFRQGCWNPWRPRWDRTVPSSCGTGLW